ncbi:MAG: PKD domain-containing protein [Bacteroidetes bacterium]|nr:PKD domain-containing protein [Bacteroidota bacterium]
MKKILLLSLVLTYAVAQCQTPITFTSADMATAGWSQKTRKDTLPLPAINFGNKGTNQAYDFSNLVWVIQDTLNYLTPTNTQLSSIPGSDLAVTPDGINFLFTKTVAAKQTLMGFQGAFAGSILSAAYQTAPDILHFTTQYGSNFSGSYSLTKTVPGSQVGQPSVYQVRLTITGNYTDTVDAWGRIRTPVGTYKCLRVKRKDSNNTLIEAQVSQFVPIWTTVSNKNASSVHYTYPAKETKGSVMTFDYDSVDNVTGATYSLIPPAAPLPNFSDLNVSGGLVSFTDLTDGYPDTYSWNFGDGSGNSSAQNPNHTYPTNGAYYVCLTVTNAGGSNTFCDSVHVTNISSQNNPPIAVNDTASVQQPDGLTFNVGTNDIEPDGDNFCLTAVYGSSAFSIAPTGNCTSILYSPDSTFIGSDTCYYIICDGGSPVLCDTGMFVVNSGYNTALLPTASFTNTAFTYTTCMGVLLTSTSGNTDSLVWNFHPLNSNPDSTYTTNTVRYYGEYTLGAQIQVCLTAYNQFGNATHCDTAGIGCSNNISEVQLSYIQFYPNPATNLLTIDMRNNDDEAVRNYSAIEIYNALGETVKTVSDGSITVNISVAELTNGVYLATLVDATGTRRMLGRFAVER